MASFWYAKTAAFGIGGHFQAKIWHFWWPIQNLGSELFVFFLNKVVPLVKCVNVWDEYKKNVFFGLTTAYPCSVTHPCPNVFQKMMMMTRLMMMMVLLMMMMMMVLLIIFTLFFALPVARIAQRSWAKGIIRTGPTVLNLQESEVDDSAEEKEENY